MSERILITAANQISGAGAGFTDPNELFARSGQFMSVQEAVAAGVPLSLDFEHNGHTVDLSRMSSHLVCPTQIDNSNAAALSETKKKLRWSRHQLNALAVAAATLNNVHIEDSTRYGCFSATGGGGLESVFQSAMKILSGKELGSVANIHFLLSIFGSELTRRFVLAGPVGNETSACAASAIALCRLVESIQLNRADGGLMTGSDAMINEFGLDSFAGQRALGNGLIYQEGRSGFSMAEGAGAVLVERESAMITARREPIAEILGFATGSDANPDVALTDPCPKGQARTMRAALKDAHVSPEDISYIKAHGTGTPNGDPGEIQALMDVFGGHAAKLGVTALKSYCGHSLGASAAVELVLLLSMMKHQLILPTRGLTPENLAEDCQGVRHFFAPEELKPGSIVLFNAFGFGGINCSIVLRSC